MIYKFTSKASGDVVMLGAHGDQLLRLLGREPAARGIIEVADMAQALQSLRDALEQEALAAPVPDVAAVGGADQTYAEPPVALRQRLFPMMEMLRRCQAERQPVVWGV
jgi:Raf kinase inhibitor-like YbhB/YbcL family protein